MCIFKYAKQNMLPLKALSIALRCVPVDCEYLDRCCLSEATKYDTLASHFEIPAIVDIPNAVSFIGSTDM
jgi:hypothetical protein